VSQILPAINYSDIVILRTTYCKFVCICPVMRVIVRIIYSGPARGPVLFKVPFNKATIARMHKQADYEEEEEEFYLP